MLNFGGSGDCLVRLAAAVSINKKLAEPRPVLRLYGMQPAL
jgi:hypothetical protein